MRSRVRAAPSVDGRGRGEAVEGRCAGGVRSVGNDWRVAWRMMFCNHALPVCCGRRVDEDGCVTAKGTFLKERRPINFIFAFGREQTRARAVHTVCWYTHSR